MPAVAEQNLDLSVCDSATCRLQVAGGLAALYPAGSAPISDAVTTSLAAAVKSEHDASDGADAANGGVSREVGDAADTATMEWHDDVGEAVPQQAAQLDDVDSPIGVGGEAAAATHRADTVCSCLSACKRNVNLQSNRSTIFFSTETGARASSGWWEAICSVPEKFVHQMCFVMLEPCTCTRRPSTHIW
jgi:hypothetical protein